MNDGNNDKYYYHLDYSNFNSGKHSLRTYFLSSIMKEGSLTGLRYFLAQQLVCCAK